MTLDLMVGPILYFGGTWLGIVTAGFVGCYAGPGLVFDHYRMKKNRSITQIEGEAAVLINFGIVEEIGSISHGYRGLISDFFTKLNTKITWIYNASSSDLIDAINDNRYQSIAVVGHGDRDLWVAKDTSVTRRSLKSAMAVEPKKGYWLQLTCGSEGSHTLGDVVMADRNKIFCNSRHVNASLATRNLAEYMTSIAQNPYS